MGELTKICSCCGRKLPLSSFYKNKAAKDGHATLCKQCEKEKYGYKAKKNRPLVAQRGVKATLCLADFDDPQLFAELRRRGYTGELRFSKVVAV